MDFQKKTKNKKNKKIKKNKNKNNNIILWHPPVEFKQINLLLRFQEDLLIFILLKFMDYPTWISKNLFQKTANFIGRIWYFKEVV